MVFNVRWLLSEWSAGSEGIDNKVTISINGNELRATSVVDQGGAR
jgi:hypothetical protein